LENPDNRGDFDAGMCTPLNAGEKEYKALEAWVNDPEDVPGFKPIDEVYKLMGEVTAAELIKVRNKTVNDMCHLLGKKVWCLTKGAEEKSTFITAYHVWSISIEKNGINIVCDNGTFAMKNDTLFSEQEKIYKTIDSAVVALTVHLMKIGEK